MRSINIGGWRTNNKKIQEGNIVLTLDELASEGGNKLLFIEIPILGKGCVRCNLDELDWAVNALNAAHDMISEK